MRRGPAIAALALLAALLLAVAALVILPRTLPAPRPSDRALPPLAAPSDPSAPLRVTVMGTSLTARYDWPDRAAARLQAACPNRRVMLTTIARGGAASDWGAAQRDRLRDSRPDILLVEFTVNDADLRRRVGLRAARAHHEALVAAARDVSPDVRIVLVTLNRARGLRAVLRPRIAAHEAQYDALAADLDLGRLALGPDWARALAQGDADALLPDGVHPAPAAVERLVVPRVTDRLVALAGCTAG